MDIHHLRVFVSVFKNRGFSKASEELHLTQPTISDHIRALEDELDCRLFDRLGRTIIPTSAADILYSHAIEVIEMAAALKGAVSAVKNEISGKLIIGASNIPGTYLLPFLISGFQKRHPSVSFETAIFDSKIIIDKILRHEILLGIVGAAFSKEQISYTPFMEDELIVVSSPSFIKAVKITINDLVKYPMILREEGSGTRRETEKILEGKGVSLEDIKTACAFGSTDAVKQAVKAGLGIAILSRLSVIDELRHGILKEIKIKDTTMKRMFWIATHKKRSLPPAHTMFLEYIKSQSL
ncbi:MAG: LysR family transcriptional regulator [Nitrospirae bacterium]|nr:LysR family transcriptional regulator [Nitrospirota bacterium]